MAKANSTRRKAAASPSKKLRPYRELQREFERTRLAMIKVSSEMTAHPKEQAQRANADAPGEVRLGSIAQSSDLAAPEPELGAVLAEVVDDLEMARAVVQTAWQAIESLNSAEATGLDSVLRQHADNPISYCVHRLRNAIENARLRGSRMLVCKPSEDAKAVSRA